jgi:hypothetical protein
MRASSTARSSRASNRPADRPSRSGSTTVVCSTRTRVSCPSNAISGRKLAGRALVEVGATSRVLRPRNSSAWTTTAYRAPRCSWPRTPRGAGSRRISPRTTSILERWRELGELLAHAPHLLAIVLVGGEAAHLVSDRRAQPPTCRRLTECRADGLRVGHAIGADDVQRRRGGVVESDVERPCHRPSVARIVLRAARTRRCCGDRRGDQRRLRARAGARKRPVGERRSDRRDQGRALVAQGEVW